MGGFFNMDGPFFRFGNAVADIMILSLLWIAFSIPIITIGASTTALFYVTTRRISDRQGYLFRDFSSSFKANFKRSTLLWLLWLLFFTIIVTNIWLLPRMDIDATLSSILLPIQIIILIELLITAIYLFPLTARFDMGFLQTIKSAFFMANRHIFATVSILITIAAIFLSAVFVFEPILFFAMGLYAYGASFMIMGVFKKYRPEMDEDHLATAPLPELNFDEVFAETDETDEADENDESSQS